MLTFKDNDYILILGGDIVSFKDRLKEARIARGLKQKELADLIGGITGNTISNYEKGVSSPSVEIMQRIFDILEVTPNFMFQDSFNSDYNEKLNMDEIAILKKYRELDDISKNIVSYLINEELKRDNTNAKYSDNDKNANILKIPLADASLSAGTGNLLLTDSYELIEVNGNIYPNADVAFKVKGDSMEPDYYDGDIVYIHKQPTINIGEIGAFLYDDEQYIKQLIKVDGVYKLHSLNKNYKDIEITKDLITYGKVIN